MSKDKKPLSFTHPEIAKEAYGWDPDVNDVQFGLKLDWICIKGHLWKTTISKRINGTGCPYCRNTKVLAGFNDLNTLYPEIGKEAFGWDPTTVIAGSAKKLMWKCINGHVWKSTVDNRTSKKKGCPYCSNRSVAIGFNDLATTHPELAKEAFGWDPTTVIAGSAKKLMWKCSKGHEWISVVGSRSSGTHNCPYCSNKVVLKGFNDLATTHPELAKEAFGWDPTTVIAGSAKKLMWKCSKGHEWISVVGSRSSGTHNCPYCSNNVVLKGFNDLATTHPELAKEAFGWDPTTVIAGSNKKFDWKCKKNHIWKNSPNKRSHNRNCPYCGNQLLLKGFNDLATTHPELAKEAFGWDPTTVIAGSAKKLMWKCSKGHVWQTKIENRKSKNSGCLYCVNQQVLKGFNDLTSTHPELAKEAFGWDPTTVVAGSKKKLNWKCLKGHSWSAAVNSRTGVHKTGCPSCAKGGFDPNQNGYLYFLIQPQWEIYQIGITNIPDDRMARHRRNGFDLLELRGPMDGHTAQELETALLRYLKSQKADLSPDHIAGKFDGYSESWTIDSFQINNLKELIDRTREAGY